MLRDKFDFIILSILEPKPLYGLEIIREANARSEGYFSFKEGSLYPALHRLTQNGWLEGEFRDSEHNAPRRRYYRLTPEGTQELAAKRDEWTRFARAVGAFQPAVAP